MKIAVTREDIRNGRRRDPDNCAVARALTRAGINHQGVTGMTLTLRTGPRRTSIVLPSLVQEWILDFDWGSPVAPIEFDLQLPQLGENRNPQPNQRQPRPAVSCRPGTVTSPARRRLRFPITEFAGRTLARIPIFRRRTSKPAIRSGSVPHELVPD